MFIKEVVIEGFKSYRHQTKIQPLSDKVNAVVGPNGSGKSNFFQAIRFVLDADTPVLRVEERRRLLHEGTGHAVLSAYIEIILDNSDGRMPIDKDEVRIRRTVSQKKDEYRINKRITSKKDVSSYLESAGFSKSNPYYVVQQGKIMAMSTMKDSERLGLLKEIGGSKVYEDRRMESLKILQETEGRKQEISELVTRMEQKLEQLDAEKEELRKYQEIDRERQDLEFAIFDNEFSEHDRKLTQLDLQRQVETERSGEAIEALRLAQSEAKTAQAERRAQQNLYECALDSMQRTRQQREAALSRLTQLELDVADLTERLGADERMQRQSKANLISLKKLIATAEKDLEAATTVLVNIQEETEAKRSKLDQEQRRLQVLETKQGIATFASADERNKWIGDERESKLKNIEHQREQVVSLQSEISAAELDVRNQGQVLLDKMKDLKSLKTQRASSKDKVKSLVSKKDAIQNMRQKARAEEDGLSHKRNSLLEKLQKLEREVHTWWQAALQRGSAEIIERASKGICRCCLRAQTDLLFNKLGSQVKTTASQSRVAFWISSPADQIWTWQ